MQLIVSSHQWLPPFARSQLSLSNVPDKSNWLYAHAGVAWLVTLAILWQLWRYNHVALRCVLGRLSSKNI